MDIEKYFNIAFSKAQAERITTIQQISDCVVDILNITDANTSLRDTIFQEVESLLIKHHVTDGPLSSDQLIFSILPPGDEYLWKELESESELDLPRPYGDNHYTILDKIFLMRKPAYEREKVTVDEFVDAICARNYDKLIDRSNITNKYEIYIVVRALTTDKAGIDYYEATPDKSVTMDLGLD